VEFTKRDTADERPSLTGLTQGILRVEPYGLLPVHHHPAPYAETYYFTRGNGVVRLGLGPLGVADKARFLTDEARAVEGTLRAISIEPGLHVDIPAATLHGIEGGSDGCEFIWTFAATRWSDIPYVYLDASLPNRNAETMGTTAREAPLPPLDRGNDVEEKVAGEGGGGAEVEGEREREREVEGDAEASAGAALYR
jgi:hypothetical protein